MPALLIAAIVLSSAPVTVSAASVPATFSYQGRLTDSSGNLLGGSGTGYYFKFSLWNSSTVGSGTRVWPTSAPSSYQTTVKQGVFNVNIGDVANGYPDALNYNFNTSNVYLQVEVSSNNSSFETLSPRQQISSAAFAQVAGAVSGAEQSAIGTTTPASDAVATIEATTSSATALVVRGTTGQTAKILDVRNALASSLFSVNASGDVSASSTLQVTGATTLYSTLNIAGLSTLTGGIIVNSASSTIANLSLINSTTTNATTTNLYVAGVIRGAGLTSCSGSSDKLIWNSTTGLFGCGVDAGGSGSGITGLGAQYSAYQTGATQTLATTSADANVRLTITSSGDTHTFTPSFVGTLSVARGGTGISSPTAAGVLVGSYAGGAYQQIATSSLGLVTTDVAEGANLYYQNQRVQTYLDGLTKGQFFSTTSADYYKSQNNFFSTTSVAYWDSTQARWSTTSSDYYKSQNDFYSTTSADYFLTQRTTDNLPVGVSNLYFTNGLADARINATNTIGTLQYLPNLLRSTTTEATTTNLAVSSVPGSLLKTNAQGSVVAAVAGVDYLGISGGWSTTSSDYYASQNNFFSTTSADYYKSVNNFFSTTSALYWDSTQSRWSTSSSDYYKSVNNFYSTTSGDYYASQFRDFKLSGGYLAPTTSQTILANNGFVSQASSTVVGLLSVSNLLGTGSTTLQNFTGLNATTSQATTTNLAVSSISSGSLVKTTTGGALIAAVPGVDFATAATVWSTTSTDYYKSVNNFFSTTSEIYYNSQFRDWNISSGYLTPTTSITIVANNGLIAQASSTVIGAFNTTGLGTFANILANGSTTLQNFTGLRATTSQATTTNLAVTSVLGSLLKTNANGSVVAAVAGQDYASISQTFGKAFEISGGYLAPTTSQTILANNGFVSQASSTINGLLTVTNVLHTASTTLQNFTGLQATTSQATTTNLAVTSVLGSLLKTNGNGSVVPAVAGTDYASIAQTFGKAFEINGGYLAPTTSQTILANNGFVSQASSTINALLTVINVLHTGSTTLQNFTALNGTTSQATTTNFAVSSIASGSLVKATNGGAFIAAVAGVDYLTTGSAWATTSNDYYVSQFRDFKLLNGYLTPTTSQTILANNGFVSQASSTINANLIITGNSTTSQATTTNLAVSSIVSGSILKTTTGGALIAAVPGVDYLVTGGGTWATTSQDYYASQFRDFKLLNGYLTPTTSQTVLANNGFVSQASSTIAGNLTITGNSTSTNATSTNLYVSGTVRGAGLVSCSAASSKLIWDVSTGQFGCGTDAGAGGGITAIGAQYSAQQTGSSQTFATTSDPNIQLVITSSSDTHTFAPSFVGTLSVARGGTAISNPTAAGILLGSYAGGSYQQLATSSLGLLTTNVAEGSNLYYTDPRVQTYLNSIGKSFFYSTSSADYYASQFRDFKLSGGYLTPTTSQTILANNGFVSQASSTINALLTVTNVLHTSSTTLQNFTALNATTSQATTTNLAVSSITNSLLKANGQGSIIAAVAGSDYAKATDIIGKAWEVVSGYLAPTSTLGIIVNASSTINANLVISGNSTTTNATTTGLAISSIAGSLLKTNGNGSVVAAIAGQDYASLSQVFGKAFEISGGYLAPTTSQTILANNGFVSQASSTVNGLLTVTNVLHTGSTTLQNFTGLQATTTQATTTNLAVSSISSGSIVKTTTGGALVAAVAGSDYASISQIFGKAFEISGGYLTPTTSQTILANNGFVSQASSTINGLLTVVNVLHTGSTTLQNFTGLQATTTQATTTNLAVSSVTNSLLKTNGNGSVIAAVAGSDYAKATDIIGKAWEVVSGYLAPTSTLGIIVNASSTINANLVISGNSTTTNATTTALAISSITGSLLKTNGQGSIVAAVAGQDYASLSQVFGKAFELSGGYLAPTTSQTILANNGFVSQASSTINALLTVTNVLHTGSTTLQNFTALNATTSQATTTNLAVSSIASGSLVKTTNGGAFVAAVAGADYASISQIFGKTFELSGGYLVPTTSQTILANNGFVSQASSTINALLTVTNVLHTGSTTLQNFTALNGTTSQATTTNLAISSITNSLLKANGQGSIIAAVAGSDYAKATDIIGKAWEIVNGYLAPTSTSFGILVNNASSSITNLSVGYGTTTNATSTNLTVSGSLRLTALSDGCANITGGVLGSTGTSCGAAAGSWATTSENYYVSQFRDLSIQGNGYLAPTTTRGLILAASSTISALTVTLGTTTNATTTNLFASSTVIGAASGGDANLTVNRTFSGGYVAQFFATGNGVGFGKLGQNIVNGFGFYESGGDVPLFEVDPATGDLFYGSAGLVIKTGGYTGIGTSSPLAKFAVDTGNLSGPVSFVVGSSTKTDFSIAANGNITAVSGLTTLSNLLLTGSSTLQNFTGLQATTTNLAVSSIASGSIVKTTTGGALIAAVPGVDYLVSGGGTWATTSQDYYNSQFRDFRLSGGYLAPTTSQTILANNGFVSQASSTINGLLTVVNVLHTGSTTLQNFTALNATTSQATTTNLAISSVTNSLLKTNGSGSIVAAVAGSDYASLSQVFGKALEISGGYLAPTTSQTILANNGFVSQASSTINALLTVLNVLHTGSTTLQNFTGLQATTTQATTTNLAISSITGSLLKTNSNGSLVAAVAGQDYASLSQVFGKAFEISGGYLAPTTSQTILANNGLVSQASSTINALLTVLNVLHTGSTTLQNFTALNATTSQATTTNLAITSITSSLLKTNGSGSLVAAVAGLDFAKATDIIGKSWEIVNGYLSPTSTAFGILVNNASSTITNLFSINGTSTNATSTNLFATTASTTSLFVGGNLGVGTSSPTAKLEVNGLIYSGTGGFKFPDGSIQTAAAGAGGGYATIQDEGGALTTRTVLNFTGSGVSCADNSGNSRTDCTINAGAASAGGANTQLQFNDGGSLGGAGGLVYNKFTGQIGVSTSTPFGVFNIATSTRPQLVLSDPTAGLNVKSFFASSTQGALTFGVVNDQLTALTELIRLTAGGNLGIGTSTPNWSLQVASSTPVIAITDTDATVNAKHWIISSLNGNFNIGTSSDSLTSTSSYLTILNGGNVGIGSSTPTADFVVSGSSTGPLAVIDQQGTGQLLALRNAGVDKFVVNNAGGITISATTNDIVKTTTGSSKASDFSYSSSAVFNNVTSINDTLDLNDSTTTNSLAGNLGAGMFKSSATSTFAAMGAGGHVILREDGKYVIINGNSTTVSVWDGYTSSMAALADPNGRVTTLTAAAGAGSISLRRPDGRYLVVHGGTVNTTTILDPYGYFPSITGPTMSCTPTNGAGTNAFQRADGRYVVFCGGTSSTSIYDPNANTFTAGPTLTTDTFGAGAHSIQRDDGTFLVIVGGGTAHYIYNPNLGLPGATQIGAFTIKNPIASFPTVSAGAFSIRRADGKFLLLQGAINASTIYDPAATASTTNSGAGTITAQAFGPSVALADGAQSTWRQDGTYLLIIGSGSSVTNIIDPSITTSGQFTAGPSLGGNAGTGVTVFMRPNGHYAVLRGGGSALDDYDMGYVIGGTSTTAPELSASYETECILATGINPQSVLNWHTANEGTYTFQVKTGTGSCNGSYQTVQKSGDTIKLNTIADDHVQIKVFLQRSLPRFYDQEWSIRKTGQTRYRRNSIDPTVYDFSIDNGALYKRNFLDFANNTTSTSTASSSIPVTVNLQIKTDGVGLSYSQVSNPEYNTTVNGTNAAYFNAGFATSTPLNFGVATSSIVMKRPDGNFVIIAGATTTPYGNAQLYNPNDETITNLSATTTAPIGAGALAFKRPDGKFLIVLGNSTGNSTAGSGTTTTNIYDPVNNTFTYGPPLTGNAGRGALVIPLPSGKFLIVHGSYTTGSTVYDPYQNTTIQGPLNTVVVGAGSMALPRPDGTYLFVPGVTTETCTAPTTATMIFDPNQLLFRANPNVTFTTTGTGFGATAFQRTDGLYVIIKGGNTAATCAWGAVAGQGTAIYNPITNRLAVGPNFIATPAAGTASNIMRPEGTFAIPMAQDGTWLIFMGGASTTKTQIYVEKAGVELGVTEDLPNGGMQGVFYSGVGGPTAVATSTMLSQTTQQYQNLGVGAGAIAFQRPDGKFFLIAGSAQTASSTATSTVTNKVDTGWVSSGLYKTEQINVTDLDSHSVLNWKVSPTYAGISAEVRTATSQAGLQDAPTRSIDKSGQKINPGPGETWLQVTFNFKRDFPSYTGVYQDVWYNGATPIATQRPVTQPTLTEISVTKDIDFLNLQSDGATMLRISSNGNLYSAEGATINTSGADLAERYTSQVPLENGTVVSIDPQNNHGVMPTTYQYQSDALGVVSTDPGFVAGAYTKDSYPIALIGRVPVKVSTENGIIRTGDKLTASNVVGYAMKATLAGHVIGHALESFDPAKAEDCPASTVSANRMCGTIMMFVNLVDYLGTSVDDAMAASGIAPISATLAGLDTVSSGPEATTTDATSTPAEVLAIDNSAARSAQVLAYLDGLKTARITQAAARSELFADRVSAITEIVSPTITTHLLRAEAVEGLTVLSLKKLAAEEVSAGTITASGSINALSFNIYKTSLIAGVAGFDASSTDASSTTPVSTSTLAISLDNLGNGFFAGALSAQSLTVSSLQVNGTVSMLGLSVASIGAASTTVDILSDATFFGRPYFTSDTAGSAVIKMGARKVDIVFDREYVDTPIVNATIALETASSSSDLEEAIFNQDVRFIVTRKGVTGFTILLNKPAPGDMGFSWTALAVKNAKLFTSKDENAPVVQQPAPQVITPPPADTGTNTSTTTPDSAVSTSTEPAVTQPAGEQGTTTPSAPPDIIDTSSSTPAATSSVEQNP